MVRKASRLSAQLNKKMKMQDNSMSPHHSEDKKTPLNIVTLNQNGDKIKSDFDYNKFMNGTIKGVSSHLDTKSKSSKSVPKLPPSRSSAAPRRRNRSQAKL